MIDFSGELFSSIIILILYAAIFVAAEFTYRKFRIDPEVTRKITHVAGGLLGLLIPHFFQSHWTVLVLGILFFLVLLLTKRRSIMRFIHDVDRSTNGEIYFPLALAFTFSATSLTETPHLYPVAILTLTFGDAIAWFVGTKYGKYHYTIFGDRKSVEGSVAIALTSTAIILTSMFLRDAQASALSMMIAPIAGTFIAVLEAVSPRGTDNLTIPLGTWGILALTLW